MGKSRFHWLCFPFLNLTSRFRRRPLSKRTLILATVCVVYLVFVASRVGSGGRTTDRDKNRRTRGLYHLESNDALPDSADLQTGGSVVIPTRSNVVYITLKSKRLKPAHIRGTIKPKLRRKARRNKTSNSTFTQNKHDTKRNFAPKDVDDKSLQLIHESERDGVEDPHVSAIRIYSQRAPPWLSAQDVAAMRFLADAKVLRVSHVSRGELPALLIFEGDPKLSPTNSHPTRRNSVCGGQCGIIADPADTTEVFAFHLDRVLGLNRTLPAVSRKFSFLHGGRPCPVVSWDASLYPQGPAAPPSTVSLTWREYQSSLKQRCWYKNIRPKPDSGCSAIHHDEWSKLVLFDFLLQIHNRLDQSCCGFRPRQEDVCVGPGQRAQCRDPDHIHVAHIVHRSRDPRHLVFTNNKGFFDRNEDNLDFRLLEGIKELPEAAVTVLRSRKLREKLLQSLFLDQTYWESQGGRQGIDKLIDVIERRAKVLVTFINAHGIKVAAMAA